ncbi:DUF222 domain-containing protein [Nocardioides sp. HDW12B]|uniref:HNH endonuclease signature motif containing protein n=1 Tax=Nocardioides sp. HDW12B TaxID=2714939 RepID=UPI00140E14B2|nr:HNH endonuclease signature motif containing protein [Nocardioides sp. HDW12B]QIK65090.1 DUF222 domain-containing protein [Nocardioides sp. HDW12B]
MTSTVDSAPGTTRGAVEGVEVLGLDASATLSFVTGRRRAVDLAAAQELEGVAHWADLHRVGGLGSVDSEILDAMSIAEQLAAESDRRGVEGVLRLAGQGAFMVEEYAVAELATALGLGERAGRAYVGQAVELRDRLPRCWAAVMAGALPAWKARQVAERTIPLADGTAAAVDASLAPFAGRLTLARITRAVDAAILRHEPDLAAAREAEAAEKRGVWLEDALDGTSTLDARLDTPDAAALDHALDQVATTLGRLGDTDTRDVRRARALGVLADPQHALDLDAATEHAGDGTPPARTAPRRQVPTLHVHLHTDALTAFGLDRAQHPALDPALNPAEGTAGSTAGGAPLVRVDRNGQRLGARTVRTLERWLAGLTPGSRLQVTPVIDLTTDIAVDDYEIPARLRRQVTERDDTCTFPWCGNAGRHDLDHRDPYVSPDDGGPPGQTSTPNLGRLCRFHHRLKTHGGWSVHRRPDTGDLIWASPLGRLYRVDRSGTDSLGPGTCPPGEHPLDAA